MRIQLDGTSIKSEKEFHRALASALDFSGYYGANLDALWDVLTTDVTRPVHVVWQNASVSQAAMPEKFDIIAAVLRDVEKQDAEIGLQDRFTFSIEM